jgi:hypothetical protein
MYIFILYIFFRVSQFKEEKILKLKDYLQKYFHFFSPNQAKTQPQKEKTNLFFVDQINEATHIKKLKKE